MENTLTMIFPNLIKDKPHLHQIIVKELSGYPDELFQFHQKALQILETLKVFSSTDHHLRDQYILEKKKNAYISIL